MLDAVDLSRRLARDEYRARFDPLQERLRQLQYALLEAEVPTIVLFEGWDASGKGAVIQRLTERLDPRAFRAWPGAPPSELERRYHWLGRYQVRLPEDGHMALFDHSWYGRVLVERVEKFVPQRMWRPAYEQICQFERWLVDDGQVLVKLFFHISRDEQRRRLCAMERHPHEHWRVEKDDWRRNRCYDRWLEATEEMLARTNAPQAPWTVVAATDTRWTRVQVFEALVASMERALARRTQAPADVSRTHIAEEATRVARVRRDRDERDLVHAVAREAGMPLEDDNGERGSGSGAPGGAGD
jgi:AMP-polyphosphate phosphotransferase